jgi:hypothetical protein
MTLQKLLSAILVLQIGLVALAWWPEDRSALALRPLLEIEKEEIVELRIARKPTENQEPDPLHLIRGEEGWALASAGGYPAAAEKVDELLDKLVGLEVRNPIATRSDSHNALDVGEKEYGRRVQLKTASGGVELVVGAAASNSVHVRLSDASEVYVARGLSEWSLGDTARSYYDADYVRADVSELSQLRIHNDNGSLGFVREGEQWRLEGAPEDVVLNQEEIESFLAEVTVVRVAEPVGREIRPDYGLEADGTGVRVDWAIEAEDQSIAGGYRLGATAGTHTYVKATGNPFVVKAVESRFETLRGATVANFIAEPEG